MIGGLGAGHQPLSRTRRRSENRDSTNCLRMALSVERPALELLSRRASHPLGSAWPCRFPSLRARAAIPAIVSAFRTLLRVIARHGRSNGSPVSSRRPEPTQTPRLHDLHVIAKGEAPLIHKCSHSAPNRPGAAARAPIVLPTSTRVLTSAAVSGAPAARRCDSARSRRRVPAARGLGRRSAARRRGWPQPDAHFHERSLPQVRHERAAGFEQDRARRRRWRARRNPPSSTVAPTSTRPLSHGTR